MKRKRAFTLAECIVALLVVSIISAGAFTAMRVSFNSNNRNWDKFRSSIMAQNTLSAFQGSDTTSSFELKLPDIVKCGEDVQNNATAQAVVKYSEVTFENQQATYPQFTRITATESGKGTVQMKNGDSTVFSATYSDNAKYVSDVRSASDSLNNLSGTSGIYTKTGGGENTSKTITVNAIAGLQSGDNACASIQMVIENSKVKIYYRENSSKNVGNALVNNRVSKDIEYDTTPVEKYYLSKNQFLVFNGKSVGNGALYFAVFKIDSSGNISQATNSDSKYIYVKLTASGSPSGNWYDDTTGYTVTTIQEGYSTSKLTTTTNASNYDGTRGWRIDWSQTAITSVSYNTDITSSVKATSGWNSANFKFTKYPLLSTATSNNKMITYWINKTRCDSLFGSTYSSITQVKETSGSTNYYAVIKGSTEKINDFPKGSTSLTETTNGYQDAVYTLKSSPQTVKYALYKTNEIKLYNASDVMMFRCTDSKASDILNVLKGASYGFTKVAGYATGGYEKYTVAPTTGISIDKMEVTADNTIKFKSGANEVVAFKYSSAEALNGDLNAYLQYYNNGNINKNAGDTVKIHRLQDGSSYNFQIVLESTSGVQTIIYSAEHYDAIQSEQEFTYSDQTKKKTVNIKANSSTSYYYYLPENGTEGCYIKATFSDVSITASATAEPSLDIWVLSKGDINKLISDSTTSAQKSKILSAACFISYRKG